MKTFEDVVEFHGHSCPGLALGYRVAIAAMREMDIERISEDEEIVAIVENDSCAVDAIQLLTGCTFGKGNLVFKDYGKQVYTFIKRPSGDGVRIAVDYEHPEETEEEREMMRRYRGGERSEEVLRVILSRRERMVKAILDAPDPELMKVKRVKVAPPPEARIYRSIRCGICGEMVAEPRARVRDGKMVCIPCFE